MSNDRGVTAHIVLHGLRLQTVELSFPRLQDPLLDLCSLSYNFLSRPEHASKVFRASLALQVCQMIVVDALPA